MYYNLAKDKKVEDKKRKISPYQKPLLIYVYILKNGGSY